MKIIDDIKDIDFKNMDLKNIDFKNMDLKSTQTQALLLVVFAVLTAVALYLCLVFVPQVRRVFELTVNAGKMRSELKSARAVVMDFKKLKKDLSERSQKVESYEKKLPAEQEIPAFLENLSNMAKNSKVKIVGIAPFKDDKSVDKSQIYREIPILITAKSGYHELGYFLNNLENEDRFMKVADIGIKSGKASPKKHDVELMVYTYILLPENR